MPRSSRLSQFSLSYRATTVSGAENSEVPSGPVAVDVIFCPAATALLNWKLKVYNPSPSGSWSASTGLRPMNFLPSLPPPWEKNSKVKFVEGLVSSWPAIVMVVPVVVAEVSSS